MSEDKHIFEKCFTSDEVIMSFQYSVMLKLSTQREPNCDASSIH